MSGVSTYPVVSKSGASSDFVASVDSIVRTIPTCSLGLPEYEDAKEGVYNKRAAGLSPHCANVT
jgi:hypothetical protein